MSQWEKLLLRLYSLPTDMQFEELKKIYVELVRDAVQREEGKQ